MMYANIRGIKGKRSSLIEHLNSENPQLFLLTETLLQTDNELKIDGYSFFGKARRERKGGGVGILVRNDIKNLIIPHISERAIEMMWISLRRRNQNPVLIGCYYGKQETRCNKDDICEEMQLLSEEIEEYKKDGDVILFMDGNGKLGLMGEAKSRNGKLLYEIFEAQNLVVLNKSNKCTGTITRQCGEEKSAIDFVVVEPQIEENIDSMIIDEDGIFKIKGERSTDHNTIILNMTIHKVDKAKAPKKTQWRINAPEQSWQKLRNELGKIEEQVTKLLENPNWSIDEKYTKWYRLFEKAVRSTIGKTTIKNKGKEQFSDQVKVMRKQKRMIKKCLKDDNIDKTQVLSQYGEIQTILRNQILKERTEKTNQ